MKKIIYLFLLLMLPATAVSASNYTMTYLYGGTTNTYISYVNRAPDILNAVSPDYFDLVENGTLSCPKLDAKFVDFCQDKGIAVIPFISNHWDRANGIAAIAQTELLTDQIAAKVIEYNLDGVNVDIQNITEKQRDGYTNFVKRLREKLPGKQISVAAAANPNGWTLGWHGSYDYRALADNSDFLMIMAYDESYYASDPGPVASHRFVRRSIDYALQYTTPDKVVIGVPFYGRFWIAGATVGGNAITQRDVEYLLETYPCQSTYVDDPDIQSVKITMTIGPNDPKPTLWGGTTLSAGQYEIWYDNAYSILAKLNLAKQYNLRGTGSWAIGQEHPFTWEMYADFLNSDVTPAPQEPEIPTPTPIAPNEETPFTDIIGHWAQTHIENLSRRAWVYGKTDTLFMPEDNLSRAEMAAVIVRAGQIPPSPHDNDFADTADSWARDEIAGTRYYGIVQGVEDNYFYPNRPITRAEFCVLIDRVFSLADTVDYQNNIFTDVSPQEHPWAYDSIVKLYENGMMFGYADHTFAPSRAITRAEMAAVLDRVSGVGIKPKATIFQDNAGIEQVHILPR